MHWQYQGKDILQLPDDCVGFVYQITNTTNGKMYIGKKLARFRRSRRPLKGRVNKRRYTISSDWQYYYGSSDALNEDVEKMKNRVGELEGKDKDELKKLYKKKMYAGPEQESKGASLGLVEMARRSGKPMEFSFEKINDNHTFFCVRATV